jgi:hypothetical protein
MDYKTGKKISLPGCSLYLFGDSRHRIIHRHLLINGSAIFQGVARLFHVTFRTGKKEERTGGAKNEKQSNDNGFDVGLVTCHDVWLFVAAALAWLKAAVWKYGGLSRRGG